MKEVGLRPWRTGAVIGVNGLLLLYQLVTKLHDRAMDRLDVVHNFRPEPVYLSDILWALPLALGIVLEATRSRFARITNVGWYALFALYLCVGFVLAQSHLLGFAEPEHWILGVLFMAVPSAVFAGVLAWLYAVTKAEASSGAYVA